jgi:hypothetical protein
LHFGFLINYSPSERQVFEMRKPELTTEFHVRAVGYPSSFFGTTIITAPFCPGNFLPWIYFMLASALKYAAELSQLAELECSA